MDLSRAVWVKHRTSLARFIAVCPSYKTFNMTSADDPNKQAAETGIIATTGSKLAKYELTLEILFQMYQTEPSLVQRCQKWNLGAHLGET
jgi:hypothetical protein